MLQDGKTLKTAAPADLDSLMAQLSALRDDMAVLGRSVAGTAERRGRRMAAEISDGVGEAIQYVERKGQGAEADLEKTVANHPFLALGLAVGAGLLISSLARR